MNCLHPYYVRRTEKGRVICDSHGSSWLQVPCGSCDACKKERKKEWGLRMLLEAEWFNERGIDSSFVTLTYDDEHVPLADIGDGCPTMVLRKKDLQDFMKRLRVRLDEKGYRGFTYYACGELGSTTLRPHFHIIFMGLPTLAQSVIEDAWKQGFIDVQPFDLACANYTAGYVQKKLYGDDNVVEKSFSLMSKGISERYFAEHGSDIFERGYIQFKKKKFNIPRYFWKLVEKDKIPGVAHENMIDRKYERRDYVREYLDRTYSKYGLDTYELQTKYKDELVEGLRRQLDYESRINQRNKV